MNVALGIEYSGSNYCGWQRQSHSPSVQQALEEVLSQIANQPIQVYCAGRTDTGVHATGQVVNFELTNDRPLRAWELGTNTLLPDDIAVTWAKVVADNFHARHSAMARRYRYVILNSKFRSATLAGKVTWKRNLLDSVKMHNGAQALLGENNFASFQAASCQSPTPMRCIHHVNVTRWHEFVVVDIKANAFLHHMVRNIVGCLMKVGEGLEDEDFVAHVLNQKDRTKAPETAKPDGLYLVDVEYAADLEIPHIPLGPLALADDLGS